MSDKVQSLFGGPSGAREPNENAVLALEEWLERARSGEVVGVAIAGLYHDRVSGCELRGQVNAYALIGALEACKSDLIDFIQDD